MFVVETAYNKHNLNGPQRCRGGGGVDGAAGSILMWSAFFFHHDSRCVALPYHFRSVWSRFDSIGATLQRGC
jgi:hypothetical protein